VAKQEHLHQLFDAHTKDLNEMLTEPQEIIVCPICLGKFRREAISQRKVNDGHVWPKDIRKLSKKAAHMQVLLCRSCNSRAGRGDKQMQFYEKVLAGDEAGDLHGARLVELRQQDGDISAELRVNVKMLDNGSMTITGRLDENRNFKDSSPKDQENFDIIFKAEKKVDFNVSPPRGFQPERVPGALITSAYLTAFYALGYRYILQPGMQKVRDYILLSFDKTVNDLGIPGDENFLLRRYAKAYFSDPAISIMYPLVNGKKSFVQIQFLAYEIRLPFRYMASVMNSVVESAKNYFGPYFDAMLSAGEELQLQVHCHKGIDHTCSYDYLTGKSLKPETEGGQ
jgi:hypothetical protein